MKNITLGTNNITQIDNDISSYNIAPSQEANVILKNKDLVTENINWGIKFFDKKNNQIRQIINSRLETINKKTLFKDSYIKKDA